MDKAKEYLAEEVLVEKKVITYRLLSRAIKTNVNVAKRALFDFHTSQNAKKPGSVHATYLLYGTQTAEEPSHARNGGDIDMEDDVQEPPDNVQTAVMTLVAEENLENALSKYDSLEAIHVYSISPQPMKDLQLLADATRQLGELRGPSAAEETPSTYGMIPNSHVRRRQRRGQAPVTAAAGPSTTTTTAGSSAAKAAKSVPSDAPGPNSVWNKVKTPAADDSKKASQPADAPGINSIWNKRPKATADSGDTSPAPEAAESKSKALSNAPAKPAPASLRKSGSSGGGIMQAFAKGASAAKPKKKEPAPPAKPKPEDEDTSMALSDDGGGGDDDDMDVIPKAQQVASGQSRKERQEALRKMMEDDEEAEDEEAEDEEDEDKNADDEREDTPMEDAAEAPVEAVGPPVKNEGPSEVVTTSAGDGRRRGRRRVMRKKTVEDENGYLETVQELVWESFSEDEAPPPAKVAASATTAPKPKKPAPKIGQGNIMSFFAKK